MKLVPSVYVLCSCRPCLCLFSFIYTLHCTLCAWEGWHDSNIHKLTNAQWWSGTSTLWKDAKQKTIPLVSVCFFDTVNAVKSRKQLFSSLVFAFKVWILYYFAVLILQCSKKKQKSTYSKMSAVVFMQCPFMNPNFVLRSRCLFPMVFCHGSLSASRNHPADSIHAHLDALAMQPRCRALQRINQKKKRKEKNTAGLELQQKQAPTIQSNKWIKMWLNRQ